MLSRRAILRTSALAIPAAALAACTTAGVSVYQQVLADLQGMVPELGDIFSAIQTLSPKAFTQQQAAQITSALDLAGKLLASLSANTPAPTAAQTIETIESEVNTVLRDFGAVLPGAAAAFPALAPYIPIYDAVVALLPGIELWVNQVIGVVPPAASAAPPVQPIQSRFTPDQARARLGIHTVN